MNLTRSALGNRSVVLVLTGFAVLLGVLSLFTMPRMTVTARTTVPRSVLLSTIARENIFMVVRTIALDSPFVVFRTPLISLS